LKIILESFIFHHRIIDKPVQNNGNSRCISFAFLVPNFLDLDITSIFHRFLRSNKWQGKDRLDSGGHFYLLVCLDILSLVGANFEEELNNEVQS